MVKIPTTSLNHWRILFLVKTPMMSLKHIFPREILLMVKTPMTNLNHKFPWEILLMVKTPMISLNHKFLEKYY